jgi:hypothetical protein
LIAEEVEKVYPDLIVRDKEGKPYSVRYDEQIETLTAGLQKVSAQLEVSKPAPQMVNNNQ